MLAAPQLLATSFWERNNGKYSAHTLNSLEINVLFLAALSCEPPDRKSS